MSRVKVFYLLIGLAALFYRECSGAGLIVTPEPRQLTVRLGEEVNLLCNSNKRPSICLWRTPYKSIYTVGGGRSWENGRISSNPDAGDQCGLSIRAVQAQDVGAWQCEVGAVEGGEFSTTTAETSLNIILDSENSNESTETGIEGEDIVLRCGVGPGDCSWKTPYDRTYTLLLGEYAERGRIQSLADCDIRVANLQTRDQGLWSCMKGGNQVQVTKTQLKIEIPLKLSAPTSILQQADEKATLVCHANKEFDNCEWETPYESIISFTTAREQENGRLRYFGFSNLDCGIVIQGVNPRDSGGWTCRITATVAGKTQVSADIVRLFVEPTAYAEEPRRLEVSGEQYNIDYETNIYDTPDAKLADYDAFDYVNGDFDKVDPSDDSEERKLSSENKSRPQENPRTLFSGGSGVSNSKGESSQGRSSSTSPPPVPQSTESTESTTPIIHRTIEEKDGFITDIQRIGRFGTVRIDRIPDTGVSSAPALPIISSTSLSSTTSTQPTTQAPTSTTTPAPTSTTTQAPTSTTKATIVSSTLSQEQNDQDEHSVDLNPSELDFLARISGSRVDNRPFRLENETEFGTRQSSSGSRFQFGDVNLTLEGDNASVPDKSANSKDRMSTATTSTSKFVVNTSTFRAVPSKSTESSVSSSPSVSSSSGLVDRRTQQMRVEQEMLARRREESRKNEGGKTEPPPSSSTEGTTRDQGRKLETRPAGENNVQDSSDESGGRNIVRQRVRGKGRVEPESSNLGESKTREELEKEEKERKEKEEEEERRKKIERLREKQQEETKKLQEERERRRLLAEQQRKNEEEKLKKEKELKEDEEKKELELKRVEEERIKKEKEKEEELAIQKLLEQKAIEEENKLKKLEEENEKRLEAEREKIRKEYEEKRRKQLEEEREQRLKEEQEKIRKEEEAQRQKENEEKRLKAAEEERNKKLKEEQEKRRQEERERIRLGLEEQRRKKEEEDRKRIIEEERLKKEQEERQQKRIEERNKIRKDFEESQKKKQEEEERKLEEANLAEKEKELLEEAKAKEEKEELERSKERENERKEELLRLKELQAERERRLGEERDKLRKEIEAKKKQEEEELENIRIREETRRQSLEELRILQEERDRLIKDERERLLKQKDIHRQREEEEEKRRLITEEREREIQGLKEQQLLREIHLKEEREKIEAEKEKLARQQEELKRQKELLDKIRQEHEDTPPPPALRQPNQKELKRCIVTPWPADGNVTCPDSPVNRGKFFVNSGNRCQLDCHRGFVSLDARDALCNDGVLSKELVCVKPGSMLVVGGRSDTYGVLSSVELITSGGNCRNAVPSLPAMRWKNVAASLDNETVVVCGGINILGDPKTDCWKLEFPPPDAKPEWGRISSLSVPRDAAAWAAEGGKLFVTGGSLGPLSGYTASVELYQPQTDSWIAGPPLPSARASHCAVGLGNGSIIVTGGYGALGSVQRLDIDTGVWVDLPELNPLRAQHGCALVELNGRQGVLVVGGDSGGTRLNDVRFLGFGSRAEWEKIPDINTARWGRPSVGTIGGKITVIGGWDGIKALSTIEFYDEKTGTWSTSRSTRLSTERRWSAGTQISNKLFPRCAFKRQ